MENPDTWNLLTSTLAVRPLAKDEEGLSKIWETLVAEKLVQPGPEHRDLFLGIVREEVDRGEITGPSVAARISAGLKASGVALPAADTPDPWGRTAEGRRKK